MHGARLLLLALLPLLLSSCHGSSTSARTVRQPTARERAEIASTVSAVWRYESEPPESVVSLYRVRLRRPRLRPRVVGVRVSGRDPRYASVAVELRDVHGRRPGARAVLLLEREQDPTFGSWGRPVAGPAISFPLSCTAQTPRPVRDLLCPDPWRVLGLPRPRLRAQTAYAQPIPSPDLHALDWKKVVLPGGACGSSRPIRPHRYRYATEALVHPDVDLPWWNPVVVSSWGKPTFGDLDGDGRDEAALDVVCANGGGTADGQLAFSQVVFRAVGRSMRVVGILTPRQPLDPGTPHVPLSRVVAIERGRVVVSEAWYGKYDGPCCASGEARTIWAYRRGKLRPAHTTILERPWSSPLLVNDVLAEPGDQELDRYRPSRVVERPGLRLTVMIDNVGQVVERHVKVTLRIGRLSSRIVETRTIDRIAPLPARSATVVFGNLGRLRPGRTTVTIAVEDHGTNRVRYPVLVTRG